MATVAGAAVSALTPSAVGLSSSLTSASKVSSNSLALKPFFTGEAVLQSESVASGRKVSKSSSSNGLQVRSSIAKTILQNLTTQTNYIELKAAVRIAKKRGSLGSLLQFDLIDAASAIKDNAAEIAGKKIELRLISEDIDPKTNSGKLSDASAVAGWLTNTGDLDLVADEDYYSITFKVPKDFGTPGGFIIKNNHPTEFFLLSLAIINTDKSTIEFAPNAWIHPTSKYPKDRVFFSNKVYLPSVTPPGLKAYREQELEQIRGDGKGERKSSDRIYDFDVYNDLGSPDNDKKLARPVLGGSKEFPYPRRMRTGRAMTKTDPKSESRLTGVADLPYIPSDEYFLRSKNSTFLAGAIKGAVHSVIPSIKDTLDGANVNFKSRKEILDLYTKGITVDLDHTSVTPEKSAEQGNLVFLSSILAPKGANSSVIKYPTPQVIKAFENAWETDEEFARQTLAGLHPCVIQRMEAYPPKSALDPAEYGEGTALTEQHILPFLENQTVAQAIEAKKLFIIDYHDAVLPFVNRVNETQYKTYATRTIFYQNGTGQLKPVAIELSLPPKTKGGAASNRVFTPADTDNHLWRLAKIHAATVDSNYHQVLSHFTFSHAVMETFIISSHRHLSELHPIKTLLKPYFKDTLSINSAARSVLISAAGVIEEYFVMGKYAFELGAVGYGAFWRFDTQALPDSLIHRGMAEPADASHPGSVKLVMEDYPYAKDGLDVWDAIESWVKSYVEIVYKGSDDAVKADTELQAWWNEIRNVGNGDHKDATWWPKLDSTKNLVKIITTIGWIAGPSHATLNFGQWAYSGYPLNKPSTTRNLVPEKDSKEYKDLQNDPEKYLLSTVASSNQAIQVMTVLELLATHSVDEEYIGTRTYSNWTSDPEVEAAFRQFASKIAALEAIIKVRNKDPELVHRSGPAQVPYTLLVPSSTSGITGQGIPNSVSI